MSVAYHHRELRVDGRGLVEWWSVIRLLTPARPRTVPEDGAGWIIWAVETCLNR